jgi:glycerol-3-phosphate dehydrogenase (NAD(P)+)
MEKQSPIAVLGAGSWGTALALYLAHQGQPVRLWTQEPDRVATLQADRANNRYLPGYPFPALLLVTNDLAAAVADCNDILIAVPSVGFRDVLVALKRCLTPTQRIVWATKGLDPKTGQSLHEILQATLGDNRVSAVLSGPSFAREVAAGLPTAVVVASKDQAFAEAISRRFNSATFRVYLSKDVIGVEIGGLVKNVLAIATGISDGMQLGANARSALITRGLAEMIRLGIAAGGQYETLTGLAGLGDLVLTCTDNQSRNRRFGLALGAGKSIPEAEREIGQVIEGRRNAERLVAFSQKLGVEMPISEMVWEVLQEKLTIQAAMQKLLARAPKSE